jgi:hypothetical protein
MKLCAVYFALFVTLGALAGCEFQEEANAKFGDQHFKTAVALIELYNVRYGSYPASLKELKFTGDWDGIALNSVVYHRLGNGYQLNVVNGWVGAPKLSYPPEFWQGLGIRESNVGGLLVK